MTPRKFLSNVLAYRWFFDGCDKQSSYCLRTGQFVFLMLMRTIHFIFSTPILIAPGTLQYPALFHWETGQALALSTHPYLGPRLRTSTSILLLLCVCTARYKETFNFTFGSFLEMKMFIHFHLVPRIEIVEPYVHSLKLFNDVCLLTNRCIYIFFSFFKLRCPINYTHNCILS